MNHFHLSISPPVIHQVNQEVLNVMEANGELGKRKTYNKISDTLKAKIGKYALNVQGYCEPAHLAWQDSHNLLTTRKNFFNENNFPD